MQAEEALRGLCSSLYNDVRPAPPADESLAAWKLQVSQLIENGAAVDQIRTGYESGVAIAAKQRQFALAEALIDQLKALGIAPSPTTYQYLVRGVALELLEQQPSVEDVRELVKDAGGSWEREMLAIVRAEDSPQFRKTPKERKLFQQRLIEGIETRLNDYERALKQFEGAEAKLSPLPYNEALRTYADNGVPFTLMLKLMVQRALLPDVDTYAALLQGARWTEIPATISQLLQSNIVDELSETATEEEAVQLKSYHVHLLWTNAMKAIINSFMKRYYDRAETIEKADLEELQRLFVFVEKQLSQAFPKFQFASREHRDEVYALRAKAAATCGLRRNLLAVLDEYVDLASAGDNQPLDKNVFLCGLELFTWSQIEILNISREEVLARAQRSDVSSSRHVAELERLYERVLKRSQSKKKVQVDSVIDSKSEATARLSRDAIELAQRIEMSRELKSYQLLVQDIFERADDSVNVVFDKLTAATGDKANAADLDVAVKLVKQYVTCATRYDMRLHDYRVHIAPQVMRRIYRVIKEATEGIQGTELSDDDLEKLDELFYHAIRTAVVYWRPQDARRLVRMKKSVFPDAKLTSREYDLLIFQRVAAHDITSAYALIQEIHNAGNAPSKYALDRLVLGVIHKMIKNPEDRPVSTPGSSTNKSDSQQAVQAQPAPTQVQEEAVDEEDVLAELESDVRDALDHEDNESIESELQFSDDLELDEDDVDQDELTRVSGVDAPTSMFEIVSFLQDWYNLHRVRPFAKTVVPVLSRLLTSRDYFELKRLLQILESMDGGLSPATTVWLEKRLDLMGLSLDDFRIRTKGTR